MTDLRKDSLSSRKTVRFAEDKHVISTDSIALSITKVQGISGKLDTYSIKMYSAGISWHVDKKFQEFIDFHKKLSDEVSDRSMDAQLPTLPSKSVFKHKKWLSSEYTKQKVEQLEKYLRSLLRTSVLKRVSRVLREFLELEKLNSSGSQLESDSSTSTASSEEEEVKERQDSRSSSDASIENGECFVNHRASSASYEEEVSNNDSNSSLRRQYFINTTNSDGFDTDDEEYSPDNKYCLAGNVKDEIIVEIENDMAAILEETDYYSSQSAEE